jgi:hypothetical protein
MISPALKCFKETFSKIFILGKLQIADKVDLDILLL